MTGCQRALLLGLLLGLTQPALAKKDKDRYPDEQPSRQGLSQAEAAEIARRQSGGRVLKVEPQGSNGPGGYRVRILSPDGHVRHIQVQDPSPDSQR